MEASGRRIDLGLNGLSRGQCQIHGSLPIMWHWENCESSCMRMKSKPKRRAGCKLASRAVETQTWIRMPSSFSNDTKQTASSLRNAWPVSASALTKKEAKQIGETLGGVKHSARRNRRLVAGGLPWD